MGSRNSVAAYYLGVMYAKGQGVIQSDIVAYAWWNTAAELNSMTSGANRRDTLASFMTKKELAEARKLAGEYWKKYVLK